MAIPTTREQMIEEGWKKLGSKVCDARNCGAKLEMWRNPKTDRVSPFNVDPFVPHFPLCPSRDSFRKDSKKIPTTGNLPF
jgi:hypothetical protein